MFFVEGNRCSHYPPPIVGDPPQPGSRSLFYEAPQMKPLEDARDPVASPPLLGRARRCSIQRPRDLLVFEAPQRVSSPHYDPEKFDVGDGRRIEPAVASSVDSHRGGDSPHVLNGWSWVRLASQGVEVSAISRFRYLRVARQIANVLAHHEPAHHSHTVPRSLAEDLEVAGIVDHRLDPEADGCLPVHLDRVLLHPMPDAAALLALRAPPPRFAREIPREFPTEKREDVLGVKADDGVVEQSREQSVEIRLGRENDVRGVFRLIRHPIVAQPGEKAFEERVDLPRQDGKPFGNTDARELIGKSLGSCWIREPNKTVVVLLVFQSLGVHPPGEPLVSVEAYLNSEREPSLYPDVDQAELLVHDIEIDAEAFPVLVHELERLASAAAESEAIAGLHRREHADQPVRSVSLLGQDELGLGVLVHLLLERYEGPSRFLGDFLRMLLDLIGFGRHEIFEVGQRHAQAPHQIRHASWRAYRQMTFHENPVETFKNPVYGASVHLQEFSHDGLRSHFSICGKMKPIGDTSKSFRFNNRQPTTDNHCKPFAYGKLMHTRQFGCGRRLL